MHQIERADPTPARAARRDLSRRLADVLALPQIAGGRRIERILPNAVGVDVEKVEHREPSTLSGEELERLVDAMPVRYRALVLVATYSSLRWSELVALRVDRLDLVRDVIRVEEKIVESGRLIPGTPKTERSRRR